MPFGISSTKNFSEFLKVQKGNNPDCFVNASTSICTYLLFWTLHNKFELLISGIKNVTQYSVIIERSI